MPDAIVSYPYSMFMRFHCAFGKYRWWYKLGIYKGRSSWIFRMNIQFKYKPGQIGHYGCSWKPEILNTTLDLDRCNACSKNKKSNSIERLIINIMAFYPTPPYFLKSSSPKAETLDSISSCVFWLSYISVYLSTNFQVFFSLIYF